MEWTIPAFAFPAKAGTHLPIPKEWKAELALSGFFGYIPK